MTDYLRNKYLVNFNLKQRVDEEVKQFNLKNKANEFLSISLLNP